MNCHKKDFLLYAVTDRSWLNGKTLYEQVESAIKGGVTFLQLREKQLDYDSFVQEAESIKKLCHENNIPFVINDNIDVALKVGADGVHIGQDDMHLKDARRLLGNDKIIGVSAHSVEEALSAEKNGADYLGVGAVFQTNSKSNVSNMTFENLKAICNAVSIPVVAIGGINSTNVEKLKGSGIDGVAVISAVFAQKDITTATKQLKNQIISIVEA